MTDVTGRVDLLIAQYREAPKFTRVVALLLGLLQREAIDLLDRLAASIDPDTAEGVTLDWLGERLGVNRPRIEDPNAFGFDSAGTGFDRGRFVSLRIVFGALLPLSDEWYRRVLKARSLYLRSGTSIADVNACLDQLFDSGYLVDVNLSGASAGEPMGAVQYRVRESHLRFFRLINDDRGLRDKLVPRRPGLVARMTRVTT